MKLITLPLACCLAIECSTLAAAPVITQAQFQCAYKPKVNGAWESRGHVSPEILSEGLRVNFISPNNGDASMNEMQTTNTDSEFKVEGRCPGQITLSDNRSFRIRDFVFHVFDSEIGANEGLIELTAAGMITVLGSGERDDFNKVWTVHKADLDRFDNTPEGPLKARLDPFQAKLEQTTVCGSKLNIRFDDLRAVAIRNQTSNSNERKSTYYTLGDLSVTLEPCQP